MSNCRINDSKSTVKAYNVMNYPETSDPGPTQDSQGETAHACGVCIRGYLLGRGGDYMQWCAGVSTFVFSGANCVYLLPPPHTVMLYQQLEMSMVGVFTPQKLANTKNQAVDVKHLWAYHYGSQVSLSLQKNHLSVFMLQFHNIAILGRLSSSTLSFQMKSNLFWKQVRL